jgi:hypothetical protein
MVQSLPDNAPLQSVVTWRHLLAGAGRRTAIQAGVIIRVSVEFPKTRRN